MFKSKAENFRICFPTRIAVHEFHASNTLKQPLSPSFFNLPAFRPPDHPGETPRTTFRRRFVHHVSLAIQVQQAQGQAEADSQEAAHGASSLDLRHPPAPDRGALADRGGGMSAAAGRCCSGRPCSAGAELCLCGGEGSRLLSWRWVKGIVRTLHRGAMMVSRL